MFSIKEYFELAKKEIDKAKECERDNLIKASKLMGDCMLENGVVQLCGMGHGAAFQMELGYRAGGLMPFHQFYIRDLAMRGIITNAELNDEDVENRTDLVDKLYQSYNIHQKDMYLLVSHTGCEGLIVELAIRAKQEGRKVIAVVCKQALESSKSLHPTKTKLDEYADVIIDNHAPVHDTLFDVNGYKLGQISTITGNCLAQMLTAETYKYLKDGGHEAPVLLSANKAGADVHNKALSDKYLDRWNS